MTYNRMAVQGYASRYWDKPCDDGKIATNGPDVYVSQKARQFGATGPDWEGVFRSDSTGETLWFNNKMTAAEIETDIHGDQLEDCTHYISRCLIHGGISVPETSWAPYLVGYLLDRKDTKTLAEKVPVDRARRIMETGMVRQGDIIAYWKGGDYAHMGVRVEAKGISCHTWSRYNGRPFRDTWELLNEQYLYTFVHFSDDDRSPSGNMLMANGWWAAKTATGEWFYYIFPDGRIRWTNHKPSSPAPPPLDQNRRGYWFDIADSLLVIWRATGSVEQYDFSFVTSSYRGVWQYGATESPISMDRLV